MTGRENYRWRKASDINREYALFELLDGESAVLDVGFSDEGALEIAFGAAIVGKVLNLDRLLSLLDDGRIMAEEDRA